METSVTHRDINHGELLTSSEVELMETPGVGPGELRWSLLTSSEVELMETTNHMSKTVACVKYF